VWHSVIYENAVRGSKINFVTFMLSLMTF